MWDALLILNLPYPQRVFAALSLMSRIDGGEGQVPMAELASRMARTLGRPVSERQVREAMSLRPEDESFGYALAEVLGCDGHWLLYGTPRQVDRDRQVK